MTSVALAQELEVVPRTILRDVDAMTEAGLPIIVHQGRGGGIELGFNYRTRLTGLDADEAEALAVVLSDTGPMTRALGIERAAKRAADKLRESFPERVRQAIATAETRFRRASLPVAGPDPRVAAVAQAMRDGRTVTFAARGNSPVRIKVATLEFSPTGWVAIGQDGRAVAEADWHDLNISRLPGPSLADKEMARDKT